MAFSFGDYGDPLKQKAITSALRPKQPYEAPEAHPGAGGVSGGGSIYNPTTNPGGMQLPPDIGWGHSPDVMTPDMMVKRNGSSATDPFGNVVGHYDAQNKLVYNAGQGPQAPGPLPPWMTKGPMLPNFGNPGQGTYGPKFPDQGPQLPGGQGWFGPPTSRNGEAVPQVQVWHTEPPPPGFTGTVGPRPQMPTSLGGPIQSALAPTGGNGGMFPTGASPSLPVSGNMPRGIPGMAGQTPAPTQMPMPSGVGGGTGAAVPPPQAAATPPPAAAAPAPAAGHYGAVGGYDQGKMNDLSYHSPKYDLGRLTADIGVQRLMTPEGQAELQQKLAANPFYKNVQVKGDKITYTGQHGQPVTIDYIKGSKSSHPELGYLTSDNVGNGGGNPAAVAGGLSGAGGAYSPGFAGNVPFAGATWLQQLLQGLGVRI